MQAPQPGRARPVWKEPMVWLVAAIPLASVVASVALLVAAARSSGNDDAVADRVQRTAQVQVANLGPDLAAREQGLAARLRISPDAVELVPVSGTFPQESLELLLQHPLRASDDVTLTLLPAGGTWRARHAFPRDHDWHLVLAPADARWRLRGRLEDGAAEADLLPALVSP